MTPAEKAVIEAARDYVGDENANGGLLMLLASAVEALDAERAGRPWSLVVADDEVYSPATKRWHLVRSTLVEGSSIIVEMDGASKPVKVKPDARVQVRRSEMGQAVDVWAGLEVISS